MKSLYIFLYTSSHALCNAHSIIFATLQRRLSALVELRLTGNQLSNPPSGVARLPNLKKFDWSYIVVDEGHRLKNKDSRLFIVLMKEYRSRAKLILTGTPLQNNINELWNLLNFLMPAVFDTDQDFKSWFSKPFAIGEEDGDEEEEESSNEEQMVLINRLHQVVCAIHPTP